MSVDPKVGWPTFQHAPLVARSAPLGTVARPLPLIVDSDPEIGRAHV